MAVLSGPRSAKIEFNEAFDADIEIVLSDCNTLYPDFEDLPEEAQQIIANMMFNLGRSKTV